MTKKELVVLMEAPSANENNMLQTVCQVSRFARVLSNMDSPSRYSYSAEIDELLSNGIDEETINAARQNGWELSEDHNKIVKFF